MAQEKGFRSWSHFPADIFCVPGHIGIRGVLSGASVWPTVRIIYSPCIWVVGSVGVTHNLGWVTGQLLSALYLSAGSRQQAALLCCQREGRSPAEILLASGGLGSELHTFKSKEFYWPQKVSRSTIFKALGKKVWKKLWGYKTKWMDRRKVELFTLTVQSTTIVCVSVPLPQSSWILSYSPFWRPVPRTAVACIQC